MKKNFGYTIMTTLPLKEGIKFLKASKKRPTGYSRTKSIAALADFNSACVCCGVIGNKFCLGKDNAGGLHWDLYTDDDIALSVDHILPKALGGTNHITNLQIMCTTCNSLKMHFPERTEGYKLLLDLLKDSGSTVELTMKAVPFLRVDYWKRLKGEIYSQVENYFREESIFDEDCGWLYTYYFKHNSHGK